MKKPFGDHKPVDENDIIKDDATLKEFLEQVTKNRAREIDKLISDIERDRDVIRYHYAKINLKMMPSIPLGLLPLLGGALLGAYSDRFLLGIIGGTLTGLTLGGTYISKISRNFTDKHYKEIEKRWENIEQTKERLLDLNYVYRD